MSQGRLLPAASRGMEPAPLLEPVQYINNDQFEIIMKYDVHDKKKLENKVYILPEPQVQFALSGTYG